MTMKLQAFPIKDIRTIDSMARSNQANSFAMMTMDAATAGGMAFLMGELEKRDPKLREPLTSVTWMRDIVAKTGGGWVETTSTYNISYATSGANEGGIIGGESNNIPVMQADIGKDLYKVFTWGHIMRVPLIDQSKLQGIGRSLDDIYNKGIRLNYQKSVDKDVYMGFPGYGTTGLVNDPNVIATSVAKGASGKTQWSSKTADEILNDVNQIMTAGWAASNYDLGGMPNHILIPPAQYAYIVGTKVSEAGNMSILEFLLQNNIGKNQGIELAIEPCRWCIGTTNGGPAGNSSIAGFGAGGNDRMVAYVNDENKVNFDLPVPLSRMMTQPIVTTMSYDTAYAAQIGQVKFLYFQPPRYADGI